MRMDLLPHLEMISFQKVCAFGIVYNKIVRIDDLEYVPFESVEIKGNLFITIKLIWYYIF